MKITQRDLIAALALTGIALLAVVLIAGMQRPTVQAQDDLPGANSAQVLNYVLNQSPYTEWSTWPADRWADFGEVITSASPHTTAAQIFVNDVALAAIETEDFAGTLPPGSLIVKESYAGTPDNPGNLRFLAMMYKVEGFNPATNDWYWLETDGTGSSILFQGADSLCINCHQQPGHADYMLRYAFGDEPAAVYNTPLPEGDTAAIVDYILNVDPYIEWGSWPATEADDFSSYLLSGEPHGATVRLFVNDRALNAFQRESFDGTLPNGSLIVKENYGGTPDNPSDLAAITLMYKVQGFNPDANDWYWVKMAGDGSTIDAEGIVDGCVSCHEQDGNSDFLLRYNFNEHAE